jgi:hypothetical protein
MTHHHDTPDELAEHLVAVDYQSLSQLLRDSELVVEDLRRKCEGQVVVPVGEVEFLTMRLVRLLDASRRSLPVHERPIPKRGPS